jgi:hypothetical protein
MSWEEYNALSEKQRAAVDFNTLLVKAVSKDNASQKIYDPTLDEKMAYEKGVEHIFGDDAKQPDEYAPETLSLLQQINYHDDAGELDDFLGLKAAITEEDLKHITVAAPANAVAFSGADQPQVDRIELTQQLADQTQRLEASLAKGTKMLQSINATANLERNTILNMVGGIPNKPPQPLGYGAGEVDTYFKQAFDALANQANTKDKDEILGVINQDLSPDELQAFKSYSDTRVGNAERFDLPLGEEKGVTYRSPEEFRDLLGIGGGR